MKFLIADNHDIMLEGVSRLLNEKNIPDNTFKASNGVEALPIALEKKPDFIISDYKMEGMNGLELLIKIKEKELDCKFLVISMIDEAAIIETLIKYGVDGFVSKESPKEEIIEAVKHIQDGRKYYCRNTQEVLKQFRRLKNDTVFLSKRELEILKMVVAEKKNQEIASDLNISVSTIETHKKNLIKKLGVKGSVGLVRYALEKKLFD
jgi:DNA-binding NarL/FixJ family response regulator